MERIAKASREPLTHRECQILAKISQGLLNKEIGWQLGVTENTIKNHITTIKRKLGLHSRLELALIPIGVQIEEMFHTIFENGLHYGVLIGIVIGKDLENNGSPDVEQIIKEHFNAN